MDRVEFYFDLGSPWSYLASTQLKGLAERTGIEVVWRPFLLGGVFKATGNKSPVYEEVDNKRAYLYPDLRTWAEYYDVPFNIPSQFPPNSLTAMRGAVVAERQGRLAEYAKAGYAAYFVHDENISERTVLTKVAERAGLNADEFDELLDTTEVKGDLKRATMDAVERGAFGAPTFFWRGQMFFGNDRLGLLEGLLERL